MSYFSNMSSRGSDIFTGNIKLKSREIPYAHFPHFCNIEDILNVLIKEWELDLPKIMLLIVSDAATLKSWDSYKELENFVTGLIKGSNATSMWIFTNGLNIGISKIIGDAFQEDYDKRSAQICVRHAKEKKVLQKATLIGLCRENLLTYQNQFETPEKVIQLENKGNNIDESKFNLNQHHTHFLIIKNQTYLKDSSSRFLLRLIDTLRLARTRENSEKNEIYPLSPVPFIAILIQGNLNCIQYILAHLKRNLPVLVIKGSGGLADVFAFAYYEVQRSFQKIKDKEYVETILRRGLNNKITSAFPDLKDNKMAQNLLCGRILECIKCSDPPEMKHITVLNVLDLTCNMEDLPVYLLQAVFKSEKSETLSLHERLKKELQLTIDWNCPEIALKKVFYKDPTFKIENGIFEQALLQKGREAFVSLFLDNGFEVHKYLNAERLTKLFGESLKENFFREVCWEGILGYRQVVKLDKYFIDSDLNWIIESLIGIPVFVSSAELNNSSHEIFDGSTSKDISIDVAKRRAITVLIIWALLSKKVQLAMVMWRHADQPVMTALTASLALDKMTVFVAENEAKEELSELSQKFASMAAGVFDLCYNDVPSKAYDSLNVQVKEWAGFSLIDMASLSQNRTFVSHSCCQKWLTNKFMGNIKIRELSWGFMTFPVYIKVILCAFLIFPMYLWVRFKEDNAHEFVGDDGFENADPYYITEPKTAKHRTPRDEVGRSHLLKYHYPSLWQMIYYMWSAPITKFWVSCIFYIIYLVLFSLAVLWPGCGSVYLDAITCFWTLLIAVDSMYRLYSIREAFPNIPLFATCLEIVYMLFFVLGYFLIRVTHLVRDPYLGKVLICIGLIWFYYRMIFIYLPISSMLGPLLYRVKTMISVDFINFMKLVAFILIGNGIAMQAILYPDYPFIAELIRKAFHKAIITLFLTPAEELTQSDSKCVKWEQKPFTETMCRVSDYVDGKCSSGKSFWPYLIVLHYILLIKLILMTVLFALFNATGARIGAETDSIWKFQRYKLIINFSNSLRLPPPLNIFSVIIIVARFFIRCCKYSISKLKKEEVKSDDADNDDEDLEKYSVSLDHSYWRQLANEYFVSKEREEEEETYVKQELDVLSQLSDDLNVQEHLIYRAKAQIRQLESDIGYIHAHLETLKYREKKQEDTKTISLHLLSRESPYPRTKIQRFPVPDKYVPWEVTWLHYEPLVYTLPKKDFSNILQPYVDDDVNMKREEGNEKSELPVFKWNVESVDNNGVYRNRKSWMTDCNNEPITYRLDLFDLPRNPMGRTGLRGKGALPRWGPNHNLFVIITRWKKKKPDQDEEELTETSDLLEYVETWFMKKKDLSLPGGFVWSENKFEVIQSCFKMSEEADVWQSHEDMIKFFRDYITESANTDEEKDEDNFTSKQIYCGYMDDHMNTDQAWKEVELWHIHYKNFTNLYKSFKSNIRWRVLSEDVFIQLPYGQTKLLQDTIRPLNAKIVDI